MDTVVRVQKSCQTCRMPHKFNKNSNIGICMHLSSQAGRSVPCHRSAICRFYQTDTREHANIVQVINNEE